VSDLTNRLTRIDPPEAEIKQSLPDDVIIWIGRPNNVRFALTELGHSLGVFAALIIQVVLFIGFISMAFFGGGNRDTIASVMLSILLLYTLIWIPVIVMSNLIKAHRTVYAVTNKHLVILIQAWLWASESVRYYTPDKIAYLKRTGNSVGTGNLEFRRDARFSWDKRYHRWRVRYRKVGFWGVADVRTVEETIRYQFHIKQ
jgi:hypothetical protein